MKSERRHATYILRDIAAHLGAYKKAVEEFDWGEQARAVPVYQLEFLLARAGHYFLAFSAEFERGYGEEPLPVVNRSVERALAKARKLIDAQLERWGWAFVKTAEGLAEAYRRRDVFHAEKEKAFLAAVRTWRSSDDVEENPRADREADRARVLGIERIPNLSTAEAEALTLRLLDEQNHQPILADAPPKATSDEVTMLCRLLDIIEGFVATLVDPQEFAARATEPEQRTSPEGAPPDAPVDRQVETCPRCGGPLAERDRGRWCRSCRIPPPGTLHHLSVAYKIARQSADGRRHASPFMPHFPAIRELSCRLFRAPSFTDEIWDRLWDWLRFNCQTNPRLVALVAEERRHCSEVFGDGLLIGNVLHRMPLTEVVALLTEACDREAASGGKPSVQHGVAAQARPDEDWITLNQAHKMTAVSKSQLSKLCSNGSIETNGKSGRGRRIFAASLARYMERRETKPRKVS